MPVTAANYTVVVTDANSCATSKTLAVTQPSSFSLTASSSSGSVCAGSSATLSASGSGGTGLITYTWVSGPSTSISVVNPLTTSVYTVNATDANNCAKSSTIQITAVALPTISVNSGSICSGQSFTILPTGAPNYSYQGGSAIVSPTASTATLSVTYTVSGTSSVGCVSAPATSTVQVINNPIVLAIANQTGLCAGGTTTLFAGGAVSYTWANGPTGSSQIVTPVNTTVYTVTGTANSCASTATVSVVIFSNPNVAISATNIACNGTGTGVCTASVTGGTAPFTYSWSPSGGLAATISSLVPGTYTCLVTDANNCSATQTSAITQAPPITGSVGGISQPGCGLSNGSATLNFTGGTGTITYSWIPSGGSTSIATGLAAGTYTVMIGDANNCVTSLPLTLASPGSPTVSATFTNAGCDGSNQGAISLTVVATAPNYTFTWLPNVGTGANVSGLGSGIYTVTVVDQNSCSTTSNYTLTSFSNPTLSVVSSQTIICTGETVSLTVNGANTYSWSSGETNSVALVTPTANTIYTVVGVNADNCSDTLTYEQITDPCTGLRDNTASSALVAYPNPGNGIYWLETGNNHSALQIAIFDMKGRLLFNGPSDTPRAELDLSGYNNGLYLVIVSENGKIIGKIKLVKE